MSWYDDLGGAALPGDPMAGSEYVDVAGDFNPADYGMDIGQWPGDDDGFDWSAFVGPQNETDSRSTIQKLLGSLKGKSQGLADAGSLLGAFSQGEKSNRLDKANLTQNYDRLMLEAQADRRANEADALKKLQQTDYIKQGGAHYAPPTYELGGRTRTAPSFSFAPRDTTDTEKQGASSLQAEVMKRLGPNGSYTPTALNSYANPGTMERIGSYGALGAGGLGAAGELFGGGDPRMYSGGGRGGSKLATGLGVANTGLKAADTIGKFMSLFGGGD